MTVAAVKLVTCPTCAIKSRGWRIPAKSRDSVSHYSATCDTCGCEYIVSEGPGIVAASSSLTEWEVRVCIIMGREKGSSRLSEGKSELKENL